jgi:DNA-directed RNA polymerase subunit F
MSESKTKVKIITIPEAKEVLRAIDPEVADQIQKRTLDYLEKFSKIEASVAKGSAEELVKLGLSESEASELINVKPMSLEEIRMFTSGWKKLLPTEMIEKILKILRG